MSLPQGKVKIVFEVSPEEKEQLEKICKILGVSKITFLRNAILQAEKQLGEEPKQNVWEWDEAMGYCVKIE